MKNIVIHKADTRGHANHGWLNTYHTFSFAGYYNPERMGFGVLRVLNDDTVAPGEGFGTHPHENMEIISIPIKGDLEHKDSIGNISVIKEGDIQVMSAGRGIYHSEYNKNNDREVQFLQIWVRSNKIDVEPRYNQISLDEVKEENQLFQVLSPDPDDSGVWIYQDSWFHMGNFTKNTDIRYELKSKENGVYIFLIEGTLSVAGHDLNRRDGIGIWSADYLDLHVSKGTNVLLMEVPMG